MTTTRWLAPGLLAAFLLAEATASETLGKPYNWDAPRLDVWINDGPVK